MSTYTKVLHWLPRIICVLTIIFISLFALDSFSNPKAFLIHLIPSFILLVILTIAWRWEKAGGIILTIAGLAWSIFVFQLNMRRTHSITASLMIITMLCLPFILAGIIFLLSDSRKKKEIHKG